MAEQKYLVDINLDNNYLINVSLLNLPSPPSIVGKNPGWIYWNTVSKSVKVYTGKVSPNEWLDLGQLYVHPTTGVINPSLSGANVLSTLIVNNEGHVIEATSRVLTLSELGYTGSIDANKYIHPTFPNNSLSGSPLSGSLVISNIVVTSEGHITSFDTRSLSASDIGAPSIVHNHLLSDVSDITASANEVNLLDLAGLTPGWLLVANSESTATWRKLLGSEISNDLNWVKISDALTNTTDTWSSTKIQSLIDAINTTITGGLVNKGGYDAFANVPKLTTTPIGGIKNGWTYVVTSDGSFFSTTVQVGDMIIAKQNSPTTLAHWTVVNKNIPDIVEASESESGIIKLASEQEVKDGTDVNKAITSSTLSTRTATNTRTGILSLATSLEAISGTDANKSITPLTLKAVLDDRMGGHVSLFGNGSATQFNISHTLNTLDVFVKIIDTTINEDIIMQVRRTSVTNVNLQCNIPPLLNQYKVIIKK